MNAIPSTRTTSTLPALITAAPDLASTGPAGPAFSAFSQALQQARQDHRAADARQQSRGQEAQVQDGRRQDARRLEAQRMDAQRREVRQREAETLERQTRPSTGTPGAASAQGAGGRVALDGPAAGAVSATARDAGLDGVRPGAGPARAERGDSSAREPLPGGRDGASAARAEGDSAASAAAKERGARSAARAATDDTDQAAADRALEGASAGPTDPAATASGHRTGSGVPPLATSAGRGTSASRGLHAPGGAPAPGTVGAGTHATAGTPQGGLAAAGSSGRGITAGPDAAGMYANRADADSTNGMGTNTMGTTGNDPLAIEAAASSPGHAPSGLGTGVRELLGDATGWPGSFASGDTRGYAGAAASTQADGPGLNATGSWAGPAQAGPGRDPGDAGGTDGQAPGGPGGMATHEGHTGARLLDDSAPGADLDVAQAWAAATGAAGLNAGALSEAATPAPVERALAPPVRSEAFAPALGAQLQLLIQDGLSEARLHLNPAEMGPISVRIQIEGQTAQVEMAARDAATRQVLEQAMPTLAGALQDSGLTLTGGGVFEQSRQPAGEGGNGRQDPAWAGPGRSGSAEAPGPALPVARAVRLPQGAVDVYA